MKPENNAWASIKTHNQCRYLIAGQDLEIEDRVMRGSRGKRAYTGESYPGTDLEKKK